MTGSGLFAMAWRNIWRNRRRTLLTLSSIGFGTMLAVLFTGIGDSNWSEMIDLAARLGGGHVSVQHPEYLDTPSLSRTVADTRALIAVLEGDPDVERVVERIAGNLMLASATQNQGAVFIAYDAAREDVATLSVLEAVEGGEPFEAADDAGIILGARLAENLDVRVGRKVVLTMSDKEGEIVQEAARVRALVRTGAPSVDAGLVLLPIGVAREVLGYGAEESVQLGLFLRDQRGAADVAARLGAAVAPAAVARPWHEVQPELAAFIAMKVAGAAFMEVVIMLLVVAGIFNTLFVSVMERVREFGVMLAIGFSPGRLFGLVMCESFWLGVLGLALGLALTAGPYWYLSTVGVDIAAQLEMSGSEVAGVAISPVMHSRIYLDNLITILLVALGATLLSGLYPAWSAGRLAPVRSLRIV